MVNDSVYLIDANALMTPYRQYYAFDLCPSFWDRLTEAFDDGRIVLLEQVKREIMKGDDPLTDWMKANEEIIEVCDYKTDKIVSNYQAVLQYIQGCGLYKESALAAWAPEDIADPWLIATAMDKDYVIVTLEAPSGGLSASSPNKAAKIPDVAKAMGVQTVSLFEMMRDLGISI